MNTKRLLTISRPRFWIYELGPYLIGIIAALSTHYSVLSDNPSIIIPLIIFFIFFTYPANIYIYGINDIFDYETDKLNPKKVEYESLVLPTERKTLFKHISLVTIPFLLYAFFSISFTAIIVLLAFFFFAGFYSTPPIRAKIRPFFDSIFSAGHYVATGLFSYLIIINTLSTPSSLFEIIVATLAGMFFSIAMHAYSAIPDIKADTEAGLQTIATKLKKKDTLLLCGILYGLSAIFSFPYLGVVSLIMGTLYICMMFISYRADEQTLFKIYTYFPLINTLSGMAIFFSLMF